MPATATLVPRPQRPGKAVLAVASQSDRSRIYRMRHAVYATELRQHATNRDARLEDSLDSRNTYIVIKRDAEILGFISITAPGSGFSLDKYVRRDDLPLAFDERTFEIRLLTVMPDQRGRSIAALLMYAALVWVRMAGGRQVVGMGRCDLMRMYERVGLRRMGISVQSGELRYEVMGAPVERLFSMVRNRWPLLRRALGGVSWQLPAPGSAVGGAEACFHGGEFFSAIGDEFGELGRHRKVINADVLDAWFPPSPAVLEVLGGELPWILRTSPPTGCEGMVRAIARARGVRAENILPGAGSSDLIYLAFREWLTPDSRVLITDPAYGEYEHVLRNVVGCYVDRIGLERSKNYTLDPAELATALQAGYDLFVLVNPNSPTGQFVNSGRLQETLRGMPALTRVWIDETYIDYVEPFGGTSLEKAAAQSTNLVVCKSMSKAYALSGVRAAYLCAGAGPVASLRRVSPPWSVSLPAQIAAVKAIQDGPYYAGCYARTNCLRAELAAALDRLGLAVVPGSANFLLCHLAPHQPTAREVVQRCRRSDVFLRDAGGMGSRLGDRALRIAVKEEEANRRVIRVLGRALGARAGAGAAGLY